MTELPRIKYKSDMDVELVQCVGSDTGIAEAAWVSNFGGDIPKDKADRIPGLINFLMRDRHGCYDDKTEVLTSEGWKKWPDVVGTESFATLNLHTDRIEYQRATHRIRKPVNGPMVRIKTSQVDYLVTPDHNMVAARRVSGRGYADYALVPAHTFADRSYRVRLAGGLWSGDISDVAAGALVGFAIADGSFTGTSLEFHLTRPDKIEWLYSLGFEITKSPDNRYRVINLPETLRMWLKDTYTSSGDRRIPVDLLQRGDVGTLSAVLEGYLHGDGSTKPSGTHTCSTVSRTLVNDLQELGLKVGRPIQELKPLTDRSTAFGARTLYRLSLPTRSAEPRIGWTTEDRAKQVSTVLYNGEVHCVTVPNGTLYVRRNGKVSWCGNTPFEHNSLTFRVSAPLFVFYEWHRHRAGWSYNEESGRYRELDPVFYVPRSDRALRQIGKPGAYTFEPGDYTQQQIAYGTHRRVAQNAWGEYKALLEAGIAKEVARNVLPVSVYKTMYATCNLRSLFSFLSLRWAHPMSSVPTFPLAEIQMVAQSLDELAREKFPLAFNSFDKQGRIAP